VSCASAAGVGDGHHRRCARAHFAEHHGGEDQGRDADRLGCPQDDPCSLNLWLFGGVAQFKGWFLGAGADFRVAIAGPLVSLVLGLLFVGLAAIAGLPNALDAVAACLGYTNLILVAFNLLPALPLDGGRVLQAALWQARGDLRGRRGSPPRSAAVSVSSLSRSASPCSSSKALSAVPGSRSSAGPAPGCDGRSALHRDRAGSRRSSGVAQLKQFMDQAGHLWQEGKLADRVGTAFTSSMTTHGGQESTILALNNTLYHWGMVILPLGYTVSEVFNAGGNPYGTSFTSGKTVAGPDEAALVVARYQGQRLARYAAVIGEARAVDAFEVHRPRPEQFHAAALG
jgi:hypothetical protein